jgi:hypothetical protein
MRNKGLGALAGLGATAFVGGVVAALQGAQHPGWLWAFASAALALSVFGGIGWLLTREKHQDSPMIKAEAGHIAKAAGRDIIETTINVPTHGAEEDDQESTIEDLEQEQYKINDQTINGKDLFEQVAETLSRPRDVFLFGQEVAHVLGVPSRSVPEQQILTDWNVLGLISHVYIPQIQMGPESSVKRPESPNQWELNDAGKRLLRLLRRASGHRRKESR